MKCTSINWQRQTFDTALGRGSKPPAGESQAQREAGVRGRQPPTTEPSPSQEKPSAVASRGTAQRSTKHYQCSNDSNRFTRCARLHLLSAKRIYSAHRYTVRSATQCTAMHIAQRCTVPSASLRTSLHSAHRCTVRSIVHPPPPALHSAQHCTAPSTTLHRAQRAKTRPIAASEPGIYSAQPCTVPSATQCPALHSATQRPALHCAQRYSAPS